MCTQCRGLLVASCRSILWCSSVIFSLFSLHSELLFIAINLIQTPVKRQTYIKSKIDSQLYTKLMESRIGANVSEVCPPSSGHRLQTALERSEVDTPGSRRQNTENCLNIFLACVRSAEVFLLHPVGRSCGVAL